jgi:hypothetical protein
VRKKTRTAARGIQSIEVGVPLLRVLADHGAPMMLRDLAIAAGMPAAKAHRYLVSLVRTGLVMQDSLSGRYDLGHFALELGLACIARLDPVRMANPVLDALGEENRRNRGVGGVGQHGADHRALGRFAAAGFRQPCAPVR